MLVDAMGDGSADVRNAGAQGLGTLMKLVGERMMNQYLEQLDDIKKAKVQEEYKTAEVKAKMGPAAAPKKPAPMAAAPALKARAPPKVSPSALFSFSVTNVLHLISISPNFFKRLHPQLTRRMILLPAPRLQQNLWPSRPRVSW